MIDKGSLKFNELEHVPIEKSQATFSGHVLEFRMLGRGSTLKGVCQDSRQTFIDTYAKACFAKLHYHKTPITAAGLRNGRVLLFHAENGPYCGGFPPIAGPNSEAPTTAANANSSLSRTSTSLY